MENHTLSVWLQGGVLPLLPSHLGERLAVETIRRAVVAGEEVAAAGAPADRLIVPLDCTLSLTTPGHDRETRASTTLTAKRALFLPAVLSCGSWPKSAAAIDAGCVAELPVARLRAILEEEPAYLRFLEREVASRALQIAGQGLRANGLRVEEIWSLVNSLRRREFERGDTILSAGWPLFWVLIDTCKARIVPPGDARPVNLGVGEYYGAAALDDDLTGLEMVCTESGSAWLLDAAAFQALAERHPKLGQTLRGEHPVVVSGLRRSRHEAAAGQRRAAAVEEARSSVPLIDRIPDDETTLLRGQPVATTVDYSLRSLLTRRMLGVSAASPQETGAAALASVLGFMDVGCSYHDLKLRLGARRYPTLLELGRIAEEAGLVAHAGRADRLCTAACLPMPLIAAVGDRYVVVHRIERRKAIVFDPLGGLKEMRLPDLETVWSGQVLVLRREDRFLHQFRHEEASTRAATQGAASLSLLRACGRYLILLSESSALLRNLALFSLLLIGVGIVGPKLNALVIDRALAQREPDLLFAIVAGLAMVTFTTFVLSALKDIVQLHVSTQFNHRLTTLFYRHVLGIRFHDHETDRVGEALARFADLEQIRTTVSTEAVRVFLGLGQSLVLTLWLFTYGAKVAVVPLIAAGLIVLAWRLAGSRYRALYSLLADQAKRQKSLTVEQIEGVATLKTLGAIDRARHLWETVFAMRVHTQRRLLHTGLIFDLGVDTFAAAATIAPLYFALSAVFSGALSPGAVLAVTQYVALAVAPLWDLDGFLNGLSQTLVAFGKLDELFRRPLEITAPKRVRPGFRFLGAIASRGLRFRYSPDGPEILKGVDFEVAPGEVVAIVGRSGCGKTTLAKVIKGLLVPTQGHVLFDGIDSADIGLATIRENVGVVMQDSDLVGGSIGENIALTDAAPDGSRIVRCARLAAAAEFIEALPEGYFTHLAEGGLGLSGGQKQRICIARTIYSTPAILVLDEATSTLDGESEQTLMSNMDEILKNRTALVIAHRLNTVRNASRILVMDDGRIVESGTHGELLAARGLYHDLFSRQMNY